jgi:hypothetical protein
VGDQEKVEKDAPNNDAPKDDWVSKRFRCSLPNVFNALRLEVEEDVKTRNALRPDNSPYEFLVAHNGDELTVLLSAKDVHTSVIFSLGERAISVRDDKGTKMFDLSLAFNDAGECKLHVHDKELESWQVRRRALEELLFRGY